MAWVGDILEIPVEHKHLFVDFEAILKLILAWFLHFWDSLIFGISRLLFQRWAILWLAWVDVFSVYRSVGLAETKQIEMLEKKWKIFLEWLSDQRFCWHLITRNKIGEKDFINFKKTLKYSFISKHTYLELIWF